MAIFDVSLYEPCRPAVSADTLAYSADNSTWPTADGGLLTGADDVEGLANVISAEVYEPVHPGPGADSTLYTADESQWPTADGGVIEGATDTTDAVVNADIIVVNIYEYVAASDALDAEVVAAEAPAYGAARYYRRRRPALVYGRGYGVLPALNGEAHGIVGPPIAGMGDEAEDELLIAMLLLAA
jgi:hypothetical protein